MDDKRFKGLVDSYLGGRMGDAQMAILKSIIAANPKRKEYFDDEFPNTGLLCSTTDGGFQRLSLINRADKEFLENRGVVCSGRCQ